MMLFWYTCKCMRILSVFKHQYIPSNLSAASKYFSHLVFSCINSVGVIDTIPRYVKDVIY